MITNNGGNSDFLPVSELMVEFWQTGLGLSVTANTIESSLMATSQSANELPMTSTSPPSTSPGSTTTGVRAPSVPCGTPGIPRAA